MSNMAFTYDTKVFFFIFYKSVGTNNGHNLYTLNISSVFLQNFAFTASENTIRHQLCPSPNFLAF